MRDLAIINFMTLDGVMQGPSSPDEDPSDGFTGGGWAADYWDGVMEQVRREAMAEPYDILFGRKTYELFASHFPTADDGNPETQRMNAAMKYVATNSSPPLQWNNSRAVSGDICHEVAKLKAQQGPLIQIHGSGALARALIAADLIDEFRLWIFPVVVGAGRRLFEPGVHPRHLALHKTDACRNGVVMAFYRRMP